MTRTRVARLVEREGKWCLVCSVGSWLIEDRADKHHHFTKRDVLTVLVGEQFVSIPGAVEDSRATPCEPVDDWGERMKHDVIIPKGKKAV